MDVIDRGMAEESVTREQLYEQVWTTPLVRLALQYGVSNVALGKTCRRLNIPTPGRGYWARLAAGEKLRRPPLPKASGNQTWVRLVRDQTALPVESKAQVPEVAVPPSLDDAHPIVHKLARLLSTAAVDQHQRMTISGGCLAVTIETHRRALLVANGLCKGLRDRGHNVELRPTEGRGFKLDAVVAEQLVPFAISERLERTEHVPSPTKPDAPVKGEGYPSPKYDYWPCGRLRIDMLDSRLARRMWSDTDGRLLERILGQVIVGIEADAEDRKRRRNEEELRRAEADRQRAERLKQEAAARRKQRLSEYQHLLARDLNRIAAKWAEARQVRDFVEAFDAAVPKEQRTDPVERWIDAARKYAMRLDPLHEWSSVAREIEPSDENLDAGIAELRNPEERLKRA